MPTNTTNLSLKKPVVGADEDSWGGYINDNFDDLDDYLSGNTALPALALSGNITFGDNDKAIFGAGSDLQIYHDGSDSIINDAGAGNLFIRGTSTIILGGVTSNNVIVNDGADVKLRYNSSDKLATTNTGIAVTGDATFADNGKAIFGAGSDLQIYHDGSNSYIQDAATGSLILKSNNILLTSTGGENMMQIAQNDFVKLYHDNSPKLATTATGVDIVGTLTSDGLTVDGDGRINQTSGNASTLTFTSNGQATRYSRIKVDTDRSLILTAGVGAVNETPDIKLQTGTATGEKDRILIDGATGDISFYEDTGTTAKFFWDASAESLGIGTSSPQSSQKLHIYNSAGNAEMTLQSADGSEAALLFGDTADFSRGKIKYTSGDNMVFEVNNLSEAMRIDSSGNVSISSDGAIDSLDGVFGLQVGNSSNAASGISIATANRGYLWYIPSGSASLSLWDSTANSDRLTITSSGSVGISTSSPSQKLHVSTSSGNAYMRVERANQTTGQVGVQIGGGTSSTDWFTYMPASSNDLAFFGNSQERMRLDASGNLMVGTTDTNPTTGTSEGIVLAAGGIILASNTSDAAISLNRTTTDGNIAIFKKDGVTVGSIGTAGSRLYIESGDVGLRFLPDLDDIRPCSNSGADRDAAIDLGDSSARFKDLYLSNQAYASYFGSSGDTNTNIYFAGSDQIRFITGGGERMRIDSSGRVMINATTQKGYLTVNNNGNNTGIFIDQTSSTVNQSPLNIKSAYATGGQTAVMTRFLNTSDATVGTITSTTTSTAYNTSSDYRLKENVQPMVGASDRVLALKPVNFAWKADGTRVDGFLAHEAQEVVPEAVTGTKDGMREEEYEVTPAVLDDDGNVVTEAVMGTRQVPDYQGIDQSKLVPLLTAALQEALTKIDALETRIAALEG